MREISKERCWLNIKCLPWKLLFTPSVWSRIRFDTCHIQPNKNMYFSGGERLWKESTIILQGVRREDDGLYECMAENEEGSSPIPFYPPFPIRHLFIHRTPLLSSLKHYKTHLITLSSPLIPNPSSSSLRSPSKSFPHPAFPPTLIQCAPPQSS